MSQWALACVAGCLSIRPPRTHNPPLWIQGDFYPRPPSGPARLPLASIKMCLCMYVCAEGNTGRFFKGWEEISRGIWGRWIWMGFLLLESTADREVNSSWPGEARRGRWGGDWCMHWHTFGAQLHIPRSLSFTHHLRGLSIIIPSPYFVVILLSFCFWTI